MSQFFLFVVVRRIWLERNNIVFKGMSILCKICGESLGLMPWFGSWWLTYIVFIN